MTDLRTRLAKAEKGDRELSDEVLLAAGWTIETVDGLLRFFAPDKRRMVGRPDPTRSLSDIVALIEAAGMVWAIMSNGVAYVWPDKSQAFDLCVAIQGKGATPELAACDALLSALEARA